MNSSWFYLPWFLATLLLACVLTLVPLPQSWSTARPEWFCLALFYWTLAYPEHIGMLHAWAAGLLWDALVGAPLGFHALTLALQSYFVVISLRRVRTYPLLQQSVFLFLAVGLQLMIYRWLMGIYSRPVPDMQFMWGALTTALIWPLVGMMMRLPVRSA